MVQRDIPIARDGIYTYKGFEFGRTGEAANEDIVVYRGIETYTPELLDKFANTVVTNDHPDDQVTPENFKKEVIGTLGGRVYLRGTDVVAEKVIIQDAKAIDEIENGKKELSIGFNAEYDFSQAGEKDGVKYVATESILGINHLSLVDEGKAGALAGALYRLNGKVTNVGARKMVKFTHNGIDYEASEQVAQVFAQMNAELGDYKEKALPAKEELGYREASKNEGYNDMGELVKIVGDLGERVAAMEARYNAKDEGKEEDKDNRCNEDTDDKEESAKTNEKELEVEVEDKKKNEDLEVEVEYEEDREASKKNKRKNSAADMARAVYASRNSVQEEKPEVDFSAVANRISRGRNS
jgi:hypothetical protein